MNDQDAIDGMADAKTPEVNYVSKPSQAPSIFADTAAFATRMGSTIRVQLIETIPGAADSIEPGVNARYVANLVFPIEGFANFLSYLNEVSPNLNLPELP